MKTLSGRELARLVKRRGWTLLRINGSHHIYGKPGTVVRLSRQPAAENRLIAASSQGRANSRIRSGIDIQDID
jgi:hypothetical protein